MLEDKADTKVDKKVHSLVVSHGALRYTWAGVRKAIDGEASRGSGCIVWPLAEKAA